METEMNDAQEIYERVKGVAQVVGIVYALMCPKNNEVFYIGRTTQEPSVRLWQHIKDSTSSKSKRSEKEERIFDLFRESRIPIMKVLQFCATDTELISAEAFWYYYYNERGAPLTNGDEFSGKTYGPVRERYSALDTNKPASELLEDSIVTLYDVMKKRSLKLNSSLGLPEILPDS